MSAHSHQFWHVRGASGEGQTRNSDGRPTPVYLLAAPTRQTQRAETSVVAGNQLAGAQPLGNILRPPLRLGNLRQNYIDLLIWDTVEQMPDQV
jgi:hypothetical protein